MDIQSDRVEALREDRHFHFCKCDITINKEWVEYHVKKCDVVLPLVAIATPATYVQNPLAVFELDFEANLPIVRACVRYGKRILFPSTSEVYGMCPDPEFHPGHSNLVLGPIAKPRWIYSCSKQLLDRVIAAYGLQHGLDYTLFRPFNWIGPGLDSLHAAKEGSSRVVTQFLGHIARGEPIQLVGGGHQRRCFTDVTDGVDALMRIIANRNGATSGHIYNIGNPDNDLSVHELAQLMLEVAADIAEYATGLAKVKLVETDAERYYGRGYQDVQKRVPWIGNTRDDLGWQPRVGVRDALRRLFLAYRTEVPTVGALIEDESEPDISARKPRRQGHGENGHHAGIGNAISERAVSAQDA
jgi:nucleoside-diphosphate-sugar epimerase